MGKPTVKDQPGVPLGAQPSGAGHPDGTNAHGNAKPPKVGIPLEVTMSRSVRLAIVVGLGVLLAVAVGLIVMAPVIIR